jgi:hypothetical protein
VLERCLELLVKLREQVEKDGFSLEYNKAILEKIYGDRDENRLQEDLYDSYLTWMGTSEVSEEERAREDYASAAQCRKNVLVEIDEEIRRLKRDQKVRTSVQNARTQLEIMSHNVPDGPGLDRLLRYEAGLERSFDRTLSQLERLQRMRLGYSERGRPTCGRHPCRLQRVSKPNQINIYELFIIYRWLLLIRLSQLTTISAA